MDNEYLTKVLLLSYSTSSLIVQWQEILRKTLL